MCVKMKTFIKIILKILLPIFLFIITMSFVIENVAVKTISNDILTKRVSGYMLDEIINEVDSNTFYEIAEKIEDSPYMEEITGKYLDVLTGKIEDIDITEEINQILEEEDLQNEIPEDIKDDIRSYVSEKSEEIEDRLEVEMEAPVTDILNMYGQFTSFEFRITFIILCLVDIIVLILLEKQQVLKTIQISMFITAIISIIAFIGIRAISTFVEQYLSGGWIDNINLNMLIGCIITEVIIGFILFMIRRVLYKKESDEVVKDSK